MTGIFLDRDGVIIRKAPEGEYITQWAEVELLSGSIEAIACLHSSTSELPALLLPGW
jgi:D-glycero-D-manno-heptose 1,7-bisphosphate phosphatase